MDSSISYELQNESFKNWMCVNMAIRIAKDGLRDYVRSKMDHLKGELCSKVTIHAPGKCSLNCSKLYGGTVSSWCVICREWYSEITSRMYSDRNLRKENMLRKLLDSQEFDSVRWPTDINELYKIYSLRTSRVIEDIETDIKVICDICENCREFANCLEHAKEVRNIRNSVFHNEFHCVSNENKEKYLNVMETMLHYSEIASTSSGKAAVRNLKEIRQMELICLIQEKDEYYSIYDEIKKSSPEYIPFCEGVCNFIKHNILSTRDILFCGKIYILLFVASLLIPESQRNTECFLDGDGVLKNQVERFTMSKLDILNPASVRKSWLIKEVETSIFSDDQGMLLVAGMGYGKSAFVTSFLCTNGFQPGSKIKQNLITFHMCKYDWLWTQQPSKFIFSVADALAAKLPTYKHFIGSQTEDLLDESSCVTDVIYCIDRIIIDPLSKSFTQDKLVMIIDGLDECPYIERLLQNRMEKLAKLFQFIITTRTPAPKLCNHLKCKNLDFKDENHKADIRRFIENYINQNTGNVSYFGYDYSEFTEQLLKQSGGNTLFISLALQEMKISPLKAMFEIPKSLNELYEGNFKRVFGNDAENFTNVRIIFEIMIASQNQMTVGKLVTIGRFCKQREAITRRLITRNDISHFVLIKDDVLSLVHLTLQDWLLNEVENSVFFVDVRNGHYLIVKDFMEKSGFQENNVNGDDIVEIIPHVSESKNTLLYELFKNLSSKLISEMRFPEYFVKNSLVYLASTYNCYECIIIFYETFLPSNITFERDDIIAAKAQALALDNGNSVMSLDYLLKTIGNSN